MEAAERVEQVIQRALDNSFDRLEDYITTELTRTEVPVLERAVEIDQEEGKGASEGEEEALLEELAILRGRLGTAIQNEGRLDAIAHKVRTLRDEKSAAHVAQGEEEGEYRALLAELEAIKTQTEKVNKMSEECSRILKSENANRGQDLLAAAAVAAENDIEMANKYNIIPSWNRPYALHQLPHSASPGNLKRLQCLLLE